jgi:uncharacterized protein (TIGR03083 family)
MLRPAPTVDVLDLAPEERAELAALFRSLDPDQLETPTICKSWSVHDIGLHLLGDDLSVIARRRDGHSRAIIEAADLSELIVELDRRNERWVEAARLISPPLLIELLEVTGALTQRHFESLPSDEPGEAVAWAGMDPAPNWMSVAREFTERWIHHQQIRDALKRPGLNGPRFVAPVLAILLRSMVPAYRGIEAKPDTAVAVYIEGRAGGEWALVRSDGDWALNEGRVSDPAATIACDQDTAWRFLSRNLGRKEAEPRITLRGRLAQPFLSAKAALVSDR